MKTSITVTAAALTALLACASPVHAQLLGGGVSGAAGGALNGSLGQGAAGGLSGSAIGRGTLNGSGNLESDVPDKLGKGAAARSRKVIDHAESTIDSTRATSRAAVDETGARAMAAKSAAVAGSAQIAGTARTAGTHAAAATENAASQTTTSLSSEVNGAAAASTETPAHQDDAAMVPDAGIANVPAPSKQETTPASVGMSGSAAGKAGGSSASLDGSASGDTAGKASVTGAASAER